MKRPTGIKVSLFLLISDEEVLLSIIAISNVLENSIALPDDLIVVRVVDEGGDTSIRIQLAIFLGLMLLLGKVEDDLTKERRVRIREEERIGTRLTCKTNRAKDTL
jgi:hypothetical protein